MSDKLTLWDIDDALHSLLLMREEEGITDEERAAIDGQIRVWCDAQLAKVDGIRGYLKHAKMMEEAAAAEAASLRTRAAIWEARAKRLKEFVIAIMEQRGVNRLEGRTGQLRIQANGGKRSLRITCVDLVPDEYQLVTITIPIRTWANLCRTATGVDLKELLEIKESRAINESAVRKVLESKCEACGGLGIYAMDGVAYECEACNGTGHQLVPGAELEERGSHLRVE